MKTIITIMKLCVSKIMLIAFSILSMNASAQINASAPDLLWTENYPNVGSVSEKFHAMKPTSDLGFVAVGEVQTATGNLNSYLVKFDQDGVEEFSTDFPLGTDDDIHRDVTETDDGFAAVGYVTNSTLGNAISKTINVVTYSSTGALLGSTIIGSAVNALQHMGHSIETTNDGGFILGCEYYGNFLVLKLDASLAIEWEFTGPGSQSNAGAAYAAKQTSDGGYIVSGALGNPGASAFYVAKLNAAGMITWNNAVMGVATEVIETQDGGFIAAGYATSTAKGHGSDLDMQVMKISNTGSKEWIRQYGGIGAEIAESISQTYDGGYVLAGYTSIESDGNGDIDEVNGGIDYWVVRITTTGAILWEENLGGTNNDYASAVLQTDDAGYIVAGYSSDDAWVVRLDATNFDYCRANTLLKAYCWIENVTLADFSNTSGKGGGYVDYTDISTVLTDDGKAISVTTGAFMPNVFNTYTSVYIDYNHNGVFEKAEGIDMPVNATYYPLFVPSTALEGNTTMRVIMQAFPSSTSNPGHVESACESIFFGEIEDYTVNIQFNDVFSPSPRLSRPLTIEPIVEMSLGLPYPNPASQVVTIPVHGGSEIGVASVILRDITGRVVSQTNYQSNGVFDKELAVDVSSLPVGYYFCEVSVNNTEKKTVKVSVTR